MIVSVDFSIYIRSRGSFAHVSGRLEMDAAPSVGDTLSFTTPRDAAIAKPHAFVGLLTVEERVFDAANRAPVALMLEDLYFDSAEAAREVIPFLEGGFGLSVQVH
jgi:hypothetical protein